VSHWGTTYFLGGFMDVKAPLTFEEQYQLLCERGLYVEDKSFCETILSQVNYYRLSAYFLTFKQNDTYKNGTTFDNIYGIYEFDRKMRSLLITFLEETEIYFRTQVAYTFSHKYGALGYLNENNFSKHHNVEKFSNNFSRIIRQNERSPIIVHHEQKYLGQFPLWVLVDFFTFGMLSTFFSDMKFADQKLITRTMPNTSPVLLASWMQTLTELRNRCAHYARLYNFQLAKPPKFPRGANAAPSLRLFDSILALKWAYFDCEKFKGIFVPQLMQLLNEYKDVVILDEVGFPHNWRTLLLQ
jgi:abortive infection bacteriophage resistance protein